MSTAPATAKLYTDEAINQFLELLMQAPDPDYVLQAAGLSRAELRRLESDDEISTALETRQAACAGTPWRLDDAESTVGKFVWEQLEKHIHTIIDGAWAAVPYGYSVMETIYRKDGPRIVWDRIEQRPFEWFAPTTSGELRYFPENGAGGPWGKTVDTEYKFFMTRRKPTYRNPYGEALLSRLYWPWFFRSNGWKFWAKFLERFGSPILVGKTTGSSADMANALAAALQSAVVAVGVEDDVEAISPGNGGDAFDRYSSAVDRRIQKVVLGQTLTTDVSSSGSQALGKVHDGVRDDRRVSDCLLVTRTVQAKINALTRLNFSGATPPVFIMENAKGVQPERASRDSQLASSGIVKFTEAYLLRAYDFESGDFVVPAEAPPPVDQPAVPAKGKPGKFSATGEFFSPRKRRFTPGQETVESLGDEFIAGTGSPINPADLRGVILAASSPEDLADRLAAFLVDAEPEQYREALSKALFAAEAIGYAHAEQGTR